MRLIWIVAAGAGLVVAAGGAVLWGLKPWADKTVPPPPIVAGTGAAPISGQPAVTIPEGFLLTEARSAIPLNQEGFGWTRADNVNLPAQLDPCGEGPTGQSAIAGVRQLALVGPTLWKSERLTVYRDVAAATQAMATHREALQRCAHHDEGDGIRTEWSWQPLDLGEESFFVTGQRYRGAQGVPGNHRGVVMRQGRALLQYVDFGQRTAPATLDDVPSHRTDAATMAGKLSAALWAK
ncbi:MAG TPA: hypothetical protein VF062_00605 [Candidatus Limnocylindrales bacterium]